MKKQLTAEQKLRKLIRQEILKEISDTGKIYKSLNEDVAEIKRRFLIQWKGTPDAQTGGEVFKMFDDVYRSFDALIESLGYLSTKV